MDLFLVPNNLLRTVFVSNNGVAHYRVRTTKEKSRQISRIQRPAECEEDSIVAEVEWKSWRAPTTIRCPLLGNIGERGFGMLAASFLYKCGTFSTSRYLIGDDGAEYRWKMIRGIGWVLMCCDTDEEIARYSHVLVEEGLFAGEKRTVLRVQPLCTIDIDLVVLSFVIMEKKRRDRDGDGSKLTPHDEDPQGEGCADGGEA
ncbi:TonB box-containing protein [Collybia nuda]|uniref:TonB box-containing protein n=1 Tax=Collybia nuda TaxID=64659 RepID=A0A9P5YCH6_9AGAR|nr:TonB box-containing protein [Collybia nuda]